jgi:hypothetical protein
MPRPPQTKALDEALEKPHAARQDLAQACEGILAQRDLSPGEQALATWRQAAEAVKNEAYVVYDNANVDCDNTLRTGKRQSKARPSRRGWASLSS